MGRIDGVLVFGAGAGTLLLLAAARPPGGMTLADPGLWEISGFPTAAATSRQCFPDTAMLARLEHRRQNCTQSVISTTETTSLIHYSCASGGNGQTKVTRLTPRSLRIETQGISGGLPFNYKIQARRIGDCPAH